MRSSKPPSGLRRPRHGTWHAALSVKQATLTKRYAAYASRQARIASSMLKENPFLHGKQGTLCQAGQAEGRNSHRLAAKLASLRLAQSLKQGELARIVQDKELVGVEPPATYQGLPRLRRVGDGQGTQSWSPAGEPWKNRRCSRRVKESWQCHREAAAGHKLCEHHLYVNYYRKKFAGYKRGHSGKVKDIALQPERDSQVFLEGAGPQVPTTPPSPTYECRSAIPTAISEREDRAHYFRKQIVVLPGSSLSKHSSDGSSDGDDQGKKTTQPSHFARSPNDHHGKQIMVLSGSQVTTKNVLSSPVPVPGSIIERIVKQRQKLLQLPRAMLNSSTCDVGGRSLIPRDMKGSPSRNPPQAQQDSSGKSLYSYLLKYRLVKQQMKKAKSNGVTPAESDFTRLLPSNFQVGLRADVSEVTGLLEPRSTPRPPLSRPVRVMEAPKCKISPSSGMESRQLGRTHDGERVSVHSGDNLAYERALHSTGKDLTLVSEEIRKSVSSRKRLPSGLLKSSGPQVAQRTEGNIYQAPL